MIKKGLDRLIRCELGATGIEYSMILAFVFLAMISAVGALGESLGDLFRMVADAVTTAIGNAADGASQP